MQAQKKILFAEVRTKTFLYDAVASHLIKNGIQVTWIIQNHLFLPKNYSTKHIIPYPKKSQLKTFSSDRHIYARVSNSDRMVLYFKSKTKHYQYYWDHVNRILNIEKPDLVIGEVGNVHTHFLCIACELRKIPFYDIEGSRYPDIRFSFHNYDNYDPIYLNQSIPKEYTHEKIQTIIKSIVERSAQPFYMESVGYSKITKLKNRLGRIPYRIKLLIEFLRGEKYCTHNPIIYIYRKPLIEFKYFQLKKISTSFADLKFMGKKILLYPMQMQPEFNLDVWGRKYRDQPATILKISENLPSNWILVIKLNPKYREEINNNLKKIITNTQNTYLLDPSVSMKDIDSITECAITITGTIALERIINEKPVLVLSDSFLTQNGLVTKLEKIESLKEILNNVNALKENQAKPTTLIKELLKRSIPGNIAEPINNPLCLNSNNVINIYNGITLVLNNNEPYINSY